MPRFLLLALCAFVSSMLFSASASAQALYVGVIKISFSGTITVAPTAAGVAGFCVLADGVTVGEIGGDPVGRLANGTIAWNQPNRLTFTTGAISNGVLTASGSTTSGGLTTTLEVTANLIGGSFSPGETLTPRLSTLGFENGFTNHTALAYTGSGFVAVGNDGSCALSPDGLTWTRSALPTARNLLAVTSGNGLYVAGGEAGVLFTSANGQDWIQRTSPFGATNITGLACINGTFLMTSLLGGRAISTDGLNWTGQTPSYGQFVTTANAKFFVYSNATNTVGVSDDGVNYTTTSPNVGSGVRAVAFGDGVYVVAGASGASRSTDLANWTSTLSGQTSVVAWQNGRFVARQAGQSGQLYHSTNGSTWSETNLVNNTSVTCLAAGGGRFVLAGEDLVASDDGISWRLLRRTPFAFNYIDATATAIYADVQVLTDSSGVRRTLRMNERSLVSSGTFVWTGPGGTIFLETSTSGVTGLVNSQTTNDLYAVAGQGPENVYVAGAGGVIRRFRVFTGTPPSITVTSLTSPTTQTLRCGLNNQEPLTFVGDGGTIVRITNSTSLNPGAVAESSGTTQHLRSIQMVETKNIFQIPTRDIVVGANGTLLYRPTGSPLNTAWTAASTGTTDTLIGVQYVGPNADNTNARYVAVGERGTVVTSPDLVTWTVEKPLLAPGKLLRFRSGIVVGEFGFNARVYPLATGVYFKAGDFPNFSPYGPVGLGQVTHGGGRYVVVGGDFTAASADGRNWTSSRTPSAAVSVAYGNGVYVTVGGSGNNVAETARINYSTDAVSWQRAGALSVDRTLNSVAFGNGQFIASGGQGIILRSTDGLTWTSGGNTLASATDIIGKMLHANGMWVGVGANRLISSTDDGATFVNRTIPAVTSLSGVAFGNGRFLAVAANGYSLVSTDAINWTRNQVPAAQSSTGATPVFSTVTFSNGSFLAATGDGQIFTTADGAAWTQCYSGVSATPTGSVTANGLSLFVGSNEIFGVIQQDESPYITTQPPDRPLTEGGTLSFHVEIAGTGPIAYQWHRNGVPLANGGIVAGATTPDLVITGVTTANAGSYSLLATNAAGSRSSRAAVVTVSPQVAQTYNDWAAGYTFPPGLEAAGADADGDGLGNGLEYLSGTSPLNAGEGRRPTSQLVSGDQLNPPLSAADQYFTYTFRVRKLRPGATLVPQGAETVDGLALAGSSAHLQSAGPAVTDPNDSAYEFLTWYYDVPRASLVGGKVFVRLSVSF